jgi:hypothetical protein
MEDVELRVAGEADREGILEVIAAALGAEHAREVEQLWDWRWRQCPHLPRPGYYGGVGIWRGEVVATVTFLPAGLCRGGEPLSAFWGVDAAAHPGRLREVLRESHRRRKREGGERVRPSIVEDLLVFPDAPTAMIAKNLTPRMQTVARRVCHQLATGGGNLMRGLSVRPRLSRFLGRRLAPVAAFLPDRLIGLFPRGLAGAEIRDGDFDDSFDDLWRAAWPEYPIIGRRDAATLNWRYRRHPFQTYTTIVHREGGRLRGYAVVTVVEKRGRSRGRVVDLLTRRGDEESAVRLLTGACRILLKRGVAHVDCYVSHEDQKTPYRRLCFKSRTAPSPLFVMGECDGEFYLTAGDGDGS